MMKRSVKQQLNAKLNEMNMNLANNYKDLAHDALKELDQMVEDGFAQGSAAYEFAAKAFGGVFPPQYVMIGRQAKEKTTVDFKGIAAAADTDVVMTIAKGSYNTSLIVPISGETAATSNGFELLTVASTITPDLTFAFKSIAIDRISSTEMSSAKCSLIKLILPID